MICHFDKEFTEGVIGAEYKNTSNNYMEHEKFSKPTVNSIKKHLEDVEILEGISSSSIKRILKQKLYYRF